MYRDIVPQIKKLVTDTFRCSVTKIDPTRLQNTFEVSNLLNSVYCPLRCYKLDLNENFLFSCLATIS